MIRHTLVALVAALAATATAKPPLQVLPRGAKVDPIRVASVKKINGQISMTSDWIPYSGFSNRAIPSGCLFDCYGRDWSPSATGIPENNGVCVGDGSRYYFGSSYNLPFTNDDMSLHHDGDIGEFDVGVWWSAAAQGQNLLMFVFVGNGNPDACTQLSSGDGFALDFGSAFPATDDDYSYVNFDATTVLPPISLTGTTSYEFIMANSYDPLTGTITLATGPGQPMLWGTPGNLARYSPGAIMPGSYGNQGPNSLDDVAPTDAALDEANECYSFDFGLGFCVDWFGKMVAFGKTTDDCDRDSIQLNTGFEHTLAGGAVYPIGSLDAYYELLADPDPGTTEPRPAGVIQKHPAWVNPAPGSQWLGAYPTSIAPLNGDYIFQTCFCLQTGFHDVSLTVGARADDFVEVYLNDTLATVQANTAVPIHTGVGFGNPVLNPTTITTQSRFNTGRNCLIFRVKNTGNVAMGLNALVSISAPGFLTTDPTCCANGGTISGQKWNDLNGDGVRQSSEPILPNWTINLSSGASVTTDSNGFYYFNGLTPGSYTVTETQKPGWTQTFPAGGVGYSIVLGTNQALSGVDFGNKLECGPLAITQHPAGFRACRNIPVPFSVAAAGTAPLTYQWQVESPINSNTWTNLVNGGGNVPCGIVSGATTPTVSVSCAPLQDLICILNPLFTDGRRFRCVVTDACGNTLTSNPATLTVCLADFDCDGYVTGDDFDFYVNRFELGAEDADINCDGFVTGDDFDLYVELFIAGCPS